MLRDLEKIHNTLESRAACQIRRDVLQRNLEKGFDHDLTRRQRISASDLDPRLLPYPDAAGNFAAAYTVSYRLRELHGLLLNGSAHQLQRDHK